MVYISLMRIMQEQVVTKTILRKNVSKTADLFPEEPTQLVHPIIQRILENILSALRHTRQMICAVGMHLKFMVKAVCTRMILQKVASLLL
ncbi:hypothetical protein AX755_06045 [Enterobacter sp. SENG-6]|nr:hypothetical protein AX755_06045 [Enterobacter sp. SENG-6]